MRLIKWRDIYINTYNESLQFWYGNDGERHWPMDMELHGIKWRLNSQLFRKYSDVGGNGYCWNKWYCQPCNAAGKQQY